MLAIPNTKLRVGIRFVLPRQGDVGKKCWHLAVVATCCRHVGDIPSQVGVWLQSWPFSNLFVNSSHDGNNLNLLMFPFGFLSLLKWSHKKEKQDWSHIISLAYPYFLWNFPHLLLNHEHPNVGCVCTPYCSNKHGGGAYFSRRQKRSLWLALS